MALSKEDIRNRFTYHPPSPAGVTRHGALTAAFVEIGLLIESTCPDGREKSLAFTKLEEAKMWASAAVARNEETR